MRGVHKKLRGWRDLTELMGLCDFGMIDCPIRVRHIHGGLHLKVKINCGRTPRKSEFCTQKSDHLTFSEARGSPYSPENKSRDMTRPEPSSRQSVALPRQSFPFGP
jgi:hypothetical protein